MSSLQTFRVRQSPSLNSNSTISSPFSSSIKLHFSSRTKTLNSGFNRRVKIKCCSSGYQNDGNNIVMYPKPSEIPWRKELCNVVELIGVVGVGVEFKLLDSGKALAWTRLGVRKSATDTTWINLTFWEDLAYIAHQHVETGQRIYVSGRLIADTVEGDDGMHKTYHKVVVQQLNFVENNFHASSSNERETNLPEDRKPVNYANNNGGSTQELWQAFFANPVDWWDNRRNKKNPKYPDFKHKDTGEALWIEGKYNPHWVKSQLAILDSRMESLHSNESNSLFL